jgi:ATP-dependent DNA helicase RecG
MTLSTLIPQLTPVGKTVARRLKKLGLETAQDLLFYYPFRYDDFSQITTIDKLQPDTKASIKGKIEIIQNKRSPKKRKIITEALVADPTGSIKAIWFGQPFLTKAMKPGDEVYLSGKVEYDYYGIQLTSPSYEKVSSWKKDTIHTARLVPIYSVTKNLTQKQIRFLTKLVLPLAKKIKDWLPEEIKKELNFYDLAAALQQIHFPDNKNNLKKAEYRLKFEELFLIQLQAQSIKQELQRSKAYSIKFKEKETRKFVLSLPFKLTDSQRKTAWKILQDLEQDHPMNRLLEGEVGSGKTVVAAIAMLNVILNSYQVAYLAPTEILTKQHFETISGLLKDWQINIGLLTRTDKRIMNHELGIKNQELGIRKNTIVPSASPGTSVSEQIKKSDLIKKIKNKQIDILIGTHTLLEENIQFKNLALVIIDEQHRFGVEQRATLRNQKSDLQCPHFLSMTATPIPRSLALALYGDLDLSIIDELPADRKKIITKIVEPQDRQKAYQFIREETKKGRQVFVICPLIDPSDKLGVKSAKDEYEKLKKQIFPDLKIGLLHGRLKPKEKEKIRQEFLNNKINILVATSVIEVGVDIPNASVMMIEGAERFGLAQLYQFRGRVGRAEHQSYCFLFTETAGVKTQERLKAILFAKNCFELAEKDLEIRGPGEIYGVQQSGYLNNLKIARLTDYSIIQEAKKWAEKILQNDPDLKNHPDLKEKMTELEKPVHLE